MSPNRDAKNDYNSDDHARDHDPSQLYVSHQIRQHKLIAPKNLIAANFAMAEFICLGLSPFSGGIL